MGRTLLLPIRRNMFKEKGKVIMKSKKFLSLLMAVMMCAALFSIPAAADNDIILENISATKSEVTLDYSTAVSDNSTFTLTKNDASVEASVSKSEDGKTVVITPTVPFALDTVYVLRVTGVTNSEFTKAFMLKTLFADDFSYTNVAEMDSVWNVSYRDFGKDYTVSGFNEYAGSNIYSLENGWLVIDGNKDNGAINIKSDDVSQWNNYTLELDVKRDSRYYLDIMYHMIRVNGKPGDFSNNFRLGIYGPWRADACFTTAQVNTATEWSVFTEQQHHLKLTTNTGKDLQVFKDGTNVLSQTYNNTLASYAPGGEIGFKATGNGQGKQYIDNVLAYKLVTFEKIPVVVKLENVSATKSEVTLDYSAAVTNGTFALTQGGSAIAASVSKTNGGKTVVITPNEALTLDTVYEIHTSAVFDNINGTVLANTKAFMLKKLFADDFQSYTNASDMDGVWNVSSTVLGKDYTVSGFNEYAGSNIYSLENGWLVIDGNKDNGAININSGDVSQWNNYTLELDVKRDSRYYLDIMYHMIRVNGKPGDFSNNFRLGIYGPWRADACFTTAQVNTATEWSVFTEQQHHLKLTTNTGKDLQVFKDGTNVLSQTYNNTLASYAPGGEIGFKATGNGQGKQYIDNVLAYKLVELDNTENNITVIGIEGEYSPLVIGQDIVNVSMEYSDNEIDKVQLFAGYYKGNKLKNAQYKCVEFVNGKASVNLTMPFDEPATTEHKLRVFCWDGSLKPITNALEFNAELPKSVLDERYGSELDKQSFDDLKISEFYNNKSAAVTVTFDDGIYPAAEYYESLFKKYNIHGTAMLISDAVQESMVPQWQALFDGGYVDLGNHSKTHKVIYNDNGTTEAQIREDITGGYNKLKEYFPNEDIITFASPWTQTNSIVTDEVKKNHYANRCAGNNGFVSSSPTENTLMCLPAFVVTKDNTAAQLNNLIDKAIENKRWFVHLLHGVGGGEFDINKEVCAEHFKYIGSKSDDVWAGSFNEVVKYIYEKQNSIVSYNWIRENALSISVVDWLDDNVFNFPLTVKVNVPSDWAELEVVQNNTSATVTATAEGEKKFAYINVIPDKGEVLLQKKN